MPDSTNKTEDASARFSRTVSETTERLEKEAQQFVKYLNDEVVPTVRVHSTKALRTAAQKLQELANYMEQHSSTSK
jgi:prophage antirepressor-like protein